MINHYQQPPASNLIKPATNIIYVQGESGAKGYPVTNGYTMLLMDSEEPKFYIKQTDNMGLPSMKTFKFEEVVEPEPEKVEYITKADFEDFKNEIKALLKPVPKAKEKAGETDA
jgi:hypothetical protein